MKTVAELTRTLDEEEREYIKARHQLDEAHFIKRQYLLALIKETKEIELRSKEKNEDQKN